MRVPESLSPSAVRHPVPSSLTAASSARWCEGAEVGTEESWIGEAGRSESSRPRECFVRALGVCFEEAASTRGLLHPMPRGSVKKCQTLSVDVSVKR